MRRYRKWVLTLGIMAVTPSATMAGPFSALFKSDSDKQPAAEQSKQPAKASNQEIAEEIAAALRSENLVGRDIAIEFKSGVATLTGQIADMAQKTRATEAVSKIDGVQLVDNRLELMDGSGKPKTQPAGFEAPPQNRRMPLQQTAFQPMPLPPAAAAAPAAAAPASNQEMAERIASALGSAGMRGFKIEVRFQDGTATLVGAVATAQQKMMATEVVSQVPGVNVVENKLTAAHGPAQPMVQAQHAQRPGVPIHPTAYQPPMPPAGPGPVPPGAIPPGAAPGPVPLGAVPGMPVPPQYGHPGSGASHMVYNMPHLPEYAWPAYASYPNYAQVTYPADYSASAWPYIGPFYPYPQIPLGWRQAQLEWDDGHWSLNFNPRTNRWWWFLNPENWNDNH